MLAIMTGSAVGNALGFDFLKTMKCAIYKSCKRANAYLYVEEKNEFARVPKTLLGLLGKLEFVMTLELTPERTLAQADSNDVRRQLKEEGYYLQLPPSDFPTSPS